MDNETVSTLDDFKAAMISHAIRIQGDNYLGDEYYRSNCPSWNDYWEGGYSPEEAVREDMSYL